MLKSSMSAGRFPTCFSSPCGRPSVSSCALNYHPVLMVELVVKGPQSMGAAASASFRTICGDFQASGEKQAELVGLVLSACSVLTLLL